VFDYNSVLKNIYEFKRNSYEDSERLNEKQGSLSKVHRSQVSE